jgi:signal transduction histidine kinase
MKHYSSIKGLLFILILIILVPLILFQTYTTYSYYNDKIETELRASEQLAEAISSSLLNYIEEVWSQQLTIGIYFSHHSNLQPQRLEDTLINLSTVSDAVLDYLWIDSNGIVTASSKPKLLGVDLSGLDHIQRMLSGEEKVVSDLFISRNDGSQVVVVGRSIRKDGQLLGFVTSALDIEMLSSRLSFSTITQDSRFGFVDRSGRIVYSSHNNDISYEHRIIPPDSPIVSALDGEIVRTEKRKSSADGSLRMGINYPISELGWACFITTSYDSIMDKHYKNVIRHTLVFILVSLLSIFAALIVANRITKPINKLKKISNIIMEGDLSVRANIEGYDEIAVTAQAFDRMVDNIDQYDKLKTQFFSNLSHELKTPLNVIFGVVQLLTVKRNHDMEDYHNSVHRHLNMAKQNCYRLMRLITNLIDLTRYDSGFLSLKLGNYNIINIVEEITLSVVRFAEMKNITITFDTDTEEKIIACDLDAIERILLNLISNSIKFTKPGGQLWVSMYDKQSSIIISVKDTGIGIPKDNLNIIFDRFRQVDTSLNRTNEGSGIGLSLVKSLVEAMGGTITVDSQLQVGTEFLIELPAITVSIPHINDKIINCELSENLVERVNIEFSDIYFT